MENLVVVSKVKKYIKNKAGMSTSASFIEKLSEEVFNTTMSAINTAETNKRKTVMGRDFSFFTENPNCDEVLVVASKVKKAIKEKSGLSTSSQVMEQLTVTVEKICDLSIEHAQGDKRKTVLDRDLNMPASTEA
jgi:histone H3/H4